MIKQKTTASIALAMVSDDDKRIVLNTRQALQQGKPQHPLQVNQELLQSINYWHCCQLVCLHR